MAEYIDRGTIFGSFRLAKVITDIKNRHNVAFPQKRRQIRAVMKKEAEVIVQNLSADELGAAMEPNRSDKLKLKHDDDLEWVSFPGQSEIRFISKQKVRRQRRKDISIVPSRP
jgi:hypothetical protein